MSIIPQTKTLERVLWVKPDVETEDLNKSFFRNNLLVENEQDRIFERPELTHDIFRDKWSGRDAVDEIIDNLAKEVLSKLTEDRHKISNKHMNTLKASIQEGFRFSTSSMFERTPFKTTETREKIKKLVWRTAGGRLKLRTRIPETTGYLDRNYDEELESFTYALFEIFNVRGTLDIEREDEVTESLIHNHRNYYRQTCGSRETTITVFGNDVKDNKYLFVKEETRDSTWGIETYNGIEDTPFYGHDGLRFNVKFIHPNLTADGREIFESQDIEECRRAKKELKDITNYGMEITIRGTVPEDFSQADFEFYFNDMWVDLIAELTSMFKKFVKAHSTMVRNFFQKAWGEEQIIPSVLKDVSMYHLNYAGWRPTVLDLNADERDDFSASRFLDFIENPFPSEDAELETLCTLFSFGSSNKKCNLHMMQSVNNAVSQVTDEDIENLIE